ncbi:MAG: galactitol-1-phosphate 5-dehydrogenase [Chloroflexota bacterium]|nr:galactitol-1-phosphate 5-dehydrogenase [Chloroflexota bacterium]
MASKDRSMTALMLTDIRDLQLAEVPIPEIEAPDEVLIKVRSAGVCGSDLHGYTGASGRRQPPLIMGHEVTGEVIATGDAVEDLPVGTRVAVQPVRWCGRCSQCRAGRRNLCTQRRLMGMNAPGGYAPYVTWPAGNLFPLPDNLSFEEGALAEPLAVCVHAVGLADIRPYDTALVVGAGPIGLLTLAVLRHAGLKRLAVSDLSDARLEQAQAAGADVTINPKRQEISQVVEEMTRGEGVNIAFEAVGVSATVQQAVAATRNDGTVVWIGNNERMVEVDMQSIVTRELTVRGSYGMNDEDFQRALQMLGDGRIPTDLLINRRATLDEGPTLFEELLVSPETVKCVINFP